MKFVSIIVAAMVVEGNPQPTVDHLTLMEIVNGPDCRRVIAEKYGPDYPHAPEIDGRKVLSLKFDCLPLTDVQARKAMSLMGSE